MGISLKAFDEGSTGSGFSEVLNLIQSENALLSEDNRIPESDLQSKGNRVYHQLFGWIYRRVYGSAHYGIAADQQ